MKRLFTIVLLFLLIPLPSAGVTLPRETAVIVQSKEIIDADKVKINDKVLFEVATKPVIASGKTVIPAGTEVIGKIIKKKNNGILGIPGKIEVGEFQIEMPENKVILLSGSVYDEGNNRYWANAGWLFFITMPLIFIKGNDGKIFPSNTYILHTVEDVDL